MKFHLQHVYSFSSSSHLLTLASALILQVYITLPTKGTSSWPVQELASLDLLSPSESLPKAQATCMATLP